MEEKADRVDLQLAEQAAQWVQRLKRLKPVTPQDRDEFMAWVKESPAHVRELLLAVHVDDVLRDWIRRESARSSQAAWVINDPNPSVRGH